MPRKKQKVSIKSIAKEAGVSVATVSRVMNNRTDVSEKVRSAVRTVIEKSDFRAKKWYPGEELNLRHVV
ncbi:MAG: LacI family transcriptional regulator [Lentisphaerae bacterium]|nr:LacI family transcriptional regulator [Lentisphaerota bacterium]MCP4100630.1 LacI family transcriptional regulator [Lentisphaerota bacterium]